MLTSGIHQLSANTPDVAAILDGITHIHASCILHDHTMATFLPPLSHSEMLQHWQSLLQQCDNGNRLIVVSISPISSRTLDESVKPPFETQGLNWPVLGSLEAASSQQPSTPAQLEVSGVVSVSLPTTQTVSHRGDVQKFLVSALHRRKGIGRQLMAAMEARALELGRFGLMLDTTVGTEAESVYPRLGYERLGVVKEFGYNPSYGLDGKGEGDGRPRLLDE